jgi:hypothetical protein
VAFLAGATEARCGLLADEPVAASLSESAAPAGYPDPRDVFHFDQRRWYESLSARPAVSTAPVASIKTSTDTLTGETPGFAVDLPYESGLAISGRKLIALTLQETRRKSAQRARELGRPQVEHTLEMRQELQVRIKGKVGRKITVNVDFDDTRDDKRDISVVYQGDPDEFVQEAAFGDLVLSLPSTEFVSYSKQLFGVRARLKYKRAQLMAIGSRTKGVTETKRFNGAVKLERREIPDNAYITKRYYNLVLGPGSIAAGTERVWLDDLDNTNNNVNTTTMTVEDFTVPSSTFDGNFDLLSRGVDFTVDAVRGLLIFTRPLAANTVVAVDYTQTDALPLSGFGTPGRAKLLKTPNDLALADGNESGYRRELKTFYSLGQTKIVKDDGRGNFLFDVVDVNRNPTDVTLTDGSKLRYPDTVEVDADLGVFNLRLPERVADPSLLPGLAPDPNLYGNSPTHTFSYLVEYRYKVKTYQLRPNLVPSGEKVSLNGRQLTSGVDYFLDYDIGLLSFINDDQLDENSQIEVTYEYAPFGGQLGQTLVGARTEFNFIPDRFFAGTTLLYTFSPKPTFVPDVRSTPNSLAVVEADARVTEARLPLLPVTASLAGEIAQSQENPNLFGRALIDSMEGIKQEDVSVMNVLNWQVGANPSALAGNLSRPGALTLSDQDVKLRSINPSVPISNNDSLRVLQVGYAGLNRTGLATPLPEEASVVQSLSKGGRDFSKKQYLELWVEGAGAAGQDVDLVVDAGQFNEDADGDGTRDTEDLNNDGTLNQGEDVGFAYDYPGLDGVRGTGDDVFAAVGGSNGRVDTEDLDGDGTLRTGDNAVRPGAPLFRLSDGFTALSLQNQTPLFINDLNFTGWYALRVPLAVLPTEQDAFRAVRQVRVTVVPKTNAPDRSGAFHLGKIAFVGNAWETPVVVAGATLTVTGVNNVDDPAYAGQTLLNHPVYNDLYKDDSGVRTREQALDLTFTLPAASSATTRTVYFTPRDFSRHKTLTFFLQAPAGSSLGETFFLQIGSETDYFEYSLPVTAAQLGVWDVETLDLADVNSDGTPESLLPRNPAGQVTVVGAPSLVQVGQIKLGVRNDTGSTVAGELWVNEIFLSGARRKVGSARRLKADFRWDKWGDFGWTLRDVDRNFQTLTSPVVNQDNRNSSGYANLTRFRFLPLSTSYSRAETITPAALRTGDSGLVSLLSEGSERVTQARGDGQLILPRFPVLGFSYDTQDNHSSSLQQDRARRGGSATLDYAVPVRPDVLPGKRWTFRPLPHNLYFRLARAENTLSTFDEKKALDLSTGTLALQQNALFADATTRETTDEWSARTSLSLWDGFSLTPGFGRRRVTERREFFETELSSFSALGLLAASRYDKSRSQNQSLAASWRLARWFEPRFNYALNGTETNVLPTALDPVAFRFKTIDRSATGDFFWTLSARDLLPRFKPLQTLTVDNSYRLEDADTTQNVAQSFSGWRSVEPLRFRNIARQGGRRLFGLLGSLDLPNPEARRTVQTARNTLRSSGNWSPLSGWSPPARLAPLKTLALTVTVTDTDEHTDNTGTPRDISTRVWPDVIVTLRETEKFFNLSRWMNNSQWSLRANRRTSETFNVDSSRADALGMDYRFGILDRYDFFASWNRTTGQSLDVVAHLISSRSMDQSGSLQVGMKFGPWRHVPSASFQESSVRNGLGVLTTDNRTRNVTLTSTLDKDYAAGFRVPFTQKVFTNVSRLSLRSALSLDQRRSTREFATDNTDTYAEDLSAEYGVGKNFRLTLGGRLSVLRNKVRPEDGILTLEVNSQLVIQF